MAQNKNQKLYKPIENVIIKEVPWYSKRLILEHKMRYYFCEKYIKNKKVMDIACGSGYGSKILAQSGAKKIIGVDVNENNIKYAKKEFSDDKIVYITADAHKIPLKSASIDIIVSFETIEHLKKPKIYLNELRRLLKPNGLLIISTPNRTTSYEDNPFHLKEYTISELGSLLEVFEDKKYYGQRSVNKYVINFYKSVYRFINRIRYLNIFCFILRFRPWENLNIARIKNFSDTNYLYFIVICKR